MRDRPLIVLIGRDDRITSLRDRLGGCSRREVVLWPGDGSAPPPPPLGTTIRGLDGHLDAVVVARGERPLPQDALDALAEARGRGAMVLCESAVARDATAPQPHSVRREGLADVEGTLATLTGHLLDAEDGTADAEESAPLRQALHLLRSRRGTDLRRYRSAPLTRRMARRAVGHGVGSTLEGYVGRLQADDVELERLEADLLIGVTGFFRGQRLFRALQEQRLPGLLDRSSLPLRVWVAGCSTGQEAYSYAMLLAELGVDPADLRIFATDLKPSALDVAARGVYRRRELDGLCAERRARFLRPHPEGWQVHPDLRQAVVFAAHDLLTEPAFGGMHLVSCRNLLIYLAHDAQAEAIRRLSSALLPGGLLVLGPSESVRGDGPLQVVDRSNRIFERTGAVPAAPVEPDPGTGGPPPRSSGFVGGDQLLDRLAQRHVPRGFLVAPCGRLVESFGGAERLLRVRRRRPTMGLLDLLPAELQTTLVRAIADATWDHRRVCFPQIELAGRDGRVRVFDVGLEPVESATGALLGFFLDFRAPTRERNAERAADELTQARREIRSLRGDVRTLAAELAATRHRMEIAEQGRQALEQECRSLLDARRRVPTDTTRPREPRSPDPTTAPAAAGTQQRNRREP